MPEQTCCLEMDCGYGELGVLPVSGEGARVDG